MTWFAHDPYGGGTAIFDSQDAAIEAANDMVDEYVSRDNMQDAQGVIVGRVTHRSDLGRTIVRGVETYDYHMQPVEPAEGKHEPH